jgi:signal transduction histidine kinase
LIMRSHGGDLEHEPTPGGGATFVLRFPPRR